MIRVLIERQLKEGMDETLQNTMREMRREAIHRVGYVSGETLRHASDPSRYVIISTWRSRADWETWMNSESRKRIEARLEPLMLGKEKITVLEPA